MGMVVAFGYVVVDKGGGGGGVADGWVRLLLCGDVAIGGVFCSGHIDEILL